MSDEKKILKATVRLIEKAREVAPHYAAGTYGMGWGGTDTKSMAGLLRHSGVVLRERRFGSSAKGMAFEFGGKRIISIDLACKRSDAMFTVRHELGHVLAEEVQYALYLTAEDTMSFSERRADLFAVADLAPTAWMRYFACDKTGRLRKHAALDVVGTFRELTEGWSEQRLWDRAKLRVMLYREYGI